MEYGTRLVIRTYAVREVAIGEENRITAQGVMTVDPSVAEGLKRVHPAITDIGIRVIHPEEQDQYTNTIMDVIPISTKVLGKVGEGITNTLGGVYVLLTGVDEDGKQVCNFGASNGIIREKIEFGKAGTPDRDDVLIFFDVTVRAGTWSERAVVLGIHQACDRFIQIFRDQLKRFTGKQCTEKAEFQETYEPGRKDVVIMKEVSGQGAVYETLVFGKEPCGVEGGFSVIDAHWMPIVLTANEYRDGVLHALD
ncbi:MAG: proline reductase cluster protein PrdD [Mogibacterium sp.]|nr:proline reductase cluster protein PrdD [Mogibacterium sp.]